MPHRPAAAPLAAFAVEDRSAQLTWPWLRHDGLEVEVGPACAPLAASPPSYLRRLGRRARRIGPGPFGPGAVTVSGLDPATRYDLVVSGPGVARHRVGQLTTLPSPAGRELARFATVNDLHVGERSFGGLATIVDQVPLPTDTDPYPERAARAAVAEATAWGAQRLVVKGDLTRDSEPVEFRQAGRLLAGAGMPVDVILGNHDVRHGIDGPGILASVGIEATVGATALDLPGLRVVLAHTPLPTERRGRLGDAQLDAVVDLAGEVSPAPVLVAVHHAPQPRPLATSYPPGLYPDESRTLLARLAAANRSTVLVAGHTHRNRTRTSGPLTLVEVGSTKDYPGQWGGYVVHEGGLRQVVRRIADPGVMTWTEATKLALYGGWGWWSPGTLADRCWVRNW